MPDSTLTVYLRADGSDEAERAIRRVGQALQSTHADTLRLGVAIGVASSAATAGFSALAGAAHAALSGVGEGLVGMNSRLEQASIAFTTMLGSGEAAADFLKDLQQFAAQTPFDMPGLTEASKRLLAFGFQSKEIIPLLTAVGNAAAAMGSGTEGINRITTALGQMQAKGKLQAEEMLQLTEAGIPAWDFLAKKLNTDVAGAMDAVTKRTVDAKTFMDAFTEGTASRFGNMMEAQSHTFAGAMSTIKDTVGQLVGGAFKPFFDTLSQAADALAQFAQDETVSVWAEDLKISLGALAPLFGEVVAWLGDRMPGAMSAAEAGAHAFADAGQRLGEVLPPILDALGEVKDALGAVKDTLGEASGNFQQGAANLGEFRDTLGLLADALGDVADAFAGARAAIFPSVEDIGGAFDALGTLVQTVWGAIREGAVTAINAVIPKLDEFAGWVRDTYTPAITTLKAHWDDFWGNAGPLLAAFWGAAQPVLGMLAGLLGASLVLALQGLRAAWDLAWNNFMEAFGRFGPLLSAVADAVGGTLHDLALQVRVALQNVTPQVAQAAEETGAAVRHGFVQGVAPAAQEVTAALEPAAAAVAAVGTTAATTAPQLSTLTAATQDATGATQAHTAAVQTLDQVMRELAQSTMPEEVQQALLWQNANAALTEALKGLDVATQASILAQKNAGDVYGAVNAAFVAQGLDANDASQAIYGLAKAHDQLAASAAAAAAAEGTVGRAGISLGGSAAAAARTASGGPAPRPAATGAGAGAAAGAGETVNYGTAGTVTFGGSATPARGSAGRAPSAGEIDLALTLAGLAAIGGGPLEAETARQQARLQQAAALRVLSDRTKDLTLAQQAQVAAAQELDGSQAALALAYELSHRPLSLLAQDLQGGTVATVSQTTTLGGLISETNRYTGAVGTQATAARQLLEVGTGLASHTSDLVSIFGQAAESERGAAFYAKDLAREWGIAAQNAKDLVEGINRVGGFATPKGLNFTQIMSGTTQGGALLQGQTAGSSSGIRTFAGGGWITEPSYIVPTRTGRPSALAGEAGPEYVGGGGQTTVNITYAPAFGGGTALDKARVARELAGAIGDELSRAGFRVRG